MRSYFSENPFVEYPLIGHLKDDEKIRLLEAMGDLEAAHELDAPEATKSIFNRKPKAWEHTFHSFGFVPLVIPTSTVVPVLNAGQIEPDKSLHGAAITIRLEKLRVADYPGKGMHRILFDFYAQNSLTAGQQEHLHYNTTFRAREGEEAAAVGIPIFVDLNVGDLGLDFTCNTINLCNEGSQKALDLLESDLVKAGLQLAKTAQPAIGPLSQIALGLTKAILGSSQNVRVQEFRLGLDLENSPTGARLAQGSYFAVQVEDMDDWDWEEWVWHPGKAQLVTKLEPYKVCPFNYILFRVSRKLGS
jgi:hypothetical protein